MTYKPQRLSFISSYLATALLLGLVLGAATTYISSINLGITVAGGLVSAAYIRRRKQYDEESYTLQEDGLHVTRGTRFSSHEITVPWERVTNISYTKPFVQRLLFDTGTCFVDSAGSQTTSVTLRSVEDDVVDEVKGSVMTDEPCEAVTTPSWLAAAGTSFWQGLTGLIGLLLLFVIPTQSDGSNPVFLGVLAISVLVSAVSTIINVIDQITLSYETRPKDVRIHGGVFTKQRNVLLAKHITDTQTTQSFLERLLDVETVVVSVAGGDQEISLRFVPREASFAEAVPRGARDDTDINKPATDTEEKQEDARTTYTVSPNLARSVLGTVLFLVLLSPAYTMFPLLGVFAMFFFAQRVITPIATSYTVSADRVHQTFSFFERRNTAFDTEKITAVIVTRNPLDWLFDTVTISLQSVGSSTRLRCQHLPRSSDAVKALDTLRTIDDVEYELLPQASIRRSMVRFLPLTLFTLTLTGALFAIGDYGIAITVLSSAVLLLGLVTWRLRFAKLGFGTTTLSLRTGWLFTRRTTMDYDDVKRVTSTKYPVDDGGSITMHVPGGSQSMAIPGFTLPCVVNPWEQHGVVDGCVQEMRWAAPLSPGDSEWNDAPVLPGVALRGVPFTVVGVLLAGLLTGLDIIGGATGIISIVGVLTAYLCFVAYYASASYTRTEQRFVEEIGVVYRQASTVLTEAVDYTSTARHWYNLLTDTATVSLYTTGSDEEDLVFREISSYEAVQDDE